MLAGVHDDLFDSALAERNGGRCSLDELRPVANDRKDFHRGYTTQRLGPLAQLVEQGTLNPKVVGSIPTRPNGEAVRPAVGRTGGGRLGEPGGSPNYSRGAKLSSG